MFGGTDSISFRQDFSFLDLEAPVKVRPVAGISLSHAGHKRNKKNLESQAETRNILTAPRHATLTRVWNSSSASASHDGDHSEWSQFIAIGGSSIGYATTPASSWTSAHLNVGQNLADGIAAASMTRLLRRRIKGSGSKTGLGQVTWEVYDGITALSKKQTHALQIRDITTFYGHTATLFEHENFIVVFGGATADGMILPTGLNAWVLWLGNLNDPGWSSRLVSSQENFDNNKIKPPQGKKRCKCCHWHNCC